MHAMVFAYLSTTYSPPERVQVTSVGAVYDRAFFLESTKYARSQTAPTVGSSLLGQALVRRNTAVERCEDFVVISACFSEAQGFDAIDTDFRRVRRRLEDLHRSRDEFLQRHGVRVLYLPGAHKLGLNVWWNQFDDLDVRVFELGTQRLRVGMD